MLVVADSFDVIPRSGLMAPITLIDLSYATAFGNPPIFLFSHRLRDHVEVLHVMARRGLVALRTGMRGSRRMAKFGDRPRSGAVACRTIGAE